VNETETCEYELRKKGGSGEREELLSRWSKYDGGTRGCSFVFEAAEPKKVRK
jgi:hypothetical protein